MISIAAVGALAGNQSPAAAQTQRRLAPQDYYRLESVGGGALSPDGTQLAFVRTRIIETENRRQSEIWVVPTDGSAAPRRLTSPATSASNPRWSPDGSILAFSSNRRRPEASTGQANITWFLSMDGGGEAFRIPGVTGRPIFSPDNQWIAYTRPTRPESPVGGEPLTDEERLIESRFTGRIYDWMNYRFNGCGYLPDPRDPRATPPAEVYVVARTGGAPRQLTSLGVNASALAWRPDSGALVFTADTEQRDEDNYGRADLWVIDLEGRTTRLIDDGYSVSQPVWSPDGESLVFRRQASLNLVIATMREDVLSESAESGQWETDERIKDELRRQQASARRAPVNHGPVHGAPVDLVRLRVAGAGGAKNLTADWDLLPSQPQMSPQGELYFSGGIGGNTHLFRIGSLASSVEQVTSGNRRLNGFTFSTAFDRVAYSVTGSVHPSEMYAAELGEVGDRKLTGFNDPVLAEVEVPTAERILYPSDDGTQVEGWVLVPPGYDPAAGPYPLILSIHGGPHGAYGNSFAFEQQLYAAAGHVVVYTNPRGSTGYGEAFLWAIWGGWGTLDGQDVLAGVDHVVANWAIDEERMGVTGYSYGGFMTNWTIGHTDRFAAAVTGAGIVNWVSDYGTADIPRTKESEFFGPPWEPRGREHLERQSPIYYAGNVTTPTLFVHGEADHRVPIEEGEQMYTALKKRNVDARFIRYPDMAHGGWTPWNMVHRYHHQLEWWQRYLGSTKRATE
ncbi:MAG: S9 family peptidase [Acidobacteriota bacterium]|nr:S9 family peptidase [Acidobacteriota bacterium]